MLLCEHETGQPTGSHLRSQAVKGCKALKGGLLQNYGEHGRELITVEVALRLLQTLADPSAELQMAEKLHGAGRPDLQATLHNTVFKVLHSIVWQASCDRAGPVVVTPWRHGWVQLSEKA